MRSVLSFLKLSLSNIESSSALERESKLKRIKNKGTVRVSEDIAEDEDEDEEIEENGRDR